MSKKWLKVLVVLAVVTGCTSTQVAPPAAPRLASLTLLHQSNRFGTLEPCGCHYNPYGGIDREFNALTGLQRLNRPTLYVDAGNLFTLPNQKVKLELLQKKALAMRGMLNRMGLEVFAPGETDFALGSDFLKSLESEARFAFISSNVLKDGKPVFKPYVIQQVGGMRIGVISATPQIALKDASLSIADPKASIIQWTSELRPQVDLIVLLSQLPHKELNAIVAELDVDLVVGGDRNLASDEAFAKRDNRTLVLENSNDGYRLGRLDVELALPQRGFYSIRAMQSLEREVAQVENEIKKDPKNADAKRYLSELKAKLSAHIPDGRSSYNHSLLNLDPERFSAPNEITQMVKKYRADLRKRAISE